MRSLIAFSMYSPRRWHFYGVCIRTVWNETGIWEMNFRQKHAKQWSSFLGFCGILCGVTNYSLGLKWFTGVTVAQVVEQLSSDQKVGGSIPRPCSLNVKVALKEIQNLGLLWLVSTSHKTVVSVNSVCVSFYLHVCVNEWTLTCCVEVRLTRKALY